jgi:chorismate mutase
MCREVVHAVYGSCHASSNRFEDIREAVAASIERAVDLQGYQRSQVISGVFAAGRGLDSVFPATAARQCGLDHAAVLSVQRSGNDPGDRTIEALLHLRLD